MAINSIKRNQKGFTIVELMIALAVLSLILIMSTVIMIQIGSLFNKGVTSSNLQNSTQAVVADVTSAIQFSGSPVTQNSNNYSYNNNLGQTVVVKAYCIGTTRYSYVLNHELGTDSSNNAITPYILWRDTLTSVNADPACTPANMNPSQGQNPSTADENNGIVVQGSGYEMMPNHTQLTAFAITPDTNLGSDIYNIAISTAYGAADQFDSSGHCIFSLQSSSTAFCSTFSVNSTAEGRIY
jgi:prepilin-type N-terminal cleavage/methylation domain-containing protein